MTPDPIQTLVDAHMQRAKTVRGLLRLAMEHERSGER